MDRHGVTSCYEIIPNAVSWFTGAAVQDDDDDDEAEDDDEEQENEAPRATPGKGGNEGHRASRRCAGC